MGTAAARRRAAAPPLPKRDAILRAAIDVFASRGFFNAQVADVARAAGIAAGTVYLYFRSKDDLLVSVFERSMKEALAEARQAIDGIDDPAERLRRFARLHLGRLGRDRNLAIVFQVELRQSVKFMERFSSTLFRDYLGQIRSGHRRWTGRRHLPEGRQSNRRREDVLRRAGRDGDELDSEPPPLFARKRGGTGPRPLSHGSADAMTSRTPIRSAAVLGAGTMGAQIAAHLANAGVPVRLLDVTEQAARDGLKHAAALKPDPFFTRNGIALIGTGSLDDLSPIAAVDWIIEAVVERIDIKRDLLARVDAARRPGTIVTSNTSGIPIAALAEGRTDDFRRHWLGAHFFNPPRYLPLLELIPTPATDPTVLDRVAWFADQRLGKGVVVAKDTPNFIANHIGLFGVVQVLRVLESGAFTIEEIDAITGPAIGRPKSATFRTMDIAGVDVLGHVARNLAERLDDPEARKVFALPPLVQQMIDRGLIGDKAGQGFYRRERGRGGASEILTLDLASLTYRARQSPRLPSLEAARSIDDIRERIARSFSVRTASASSCARPSGPMLVYTARVAPEIAHTHRRRRSGDAVGIRMGARSVRDVGRHWPAERPHRRSRRRRPSTRRRAEAGAEGTVSTRRSAAGCAGSADSQVRQGSAARAAEERRREPRRSRRRRARASSLHSKMNAIGGDTVQMIHAGLKEAAANFSALVIGTDAAQFSAGANLMLLLLEAQEGNWDEIDLMIRQFQGTTQALRQSPVPVIVAPAGLALGGGCEIVLHGDRVQAAAESYIGLVEVGVGLIPGGGGTKEMLARAMEAAPAADDLLPFVQPVFETIGFGKVSTSARHASELGYLRDVRRRDDEPRAADRGCEGAGARPRPGRATGRRPDGWPSRSAARRLNAALKLGVHLAWRAGRITDHDAVVGRALARILSGGSLPHRTVGVGGLSARARAGVVSPAVRRTQDARAHAAHAQDRQAAAQLTRVIGSVMEVVDRGTGTPIVIVPGVQGRWEYMRPASTPWPSISES